MAGRGLAGRPAPGVRPFIVTFESILKIAWFVYCGCTSLCMLVAFFATCD